MKVAVNSGHLAGALNRMRIILGGKTTLPVLACVKITAEDERLTLQGTDLDNILSLEIEAKVIEPGEAVVVGSRLGAGVAAMGAGEVVIESQKRGVLCVGVEQRMTLPVFAVEEFPSEPSFPTDPASFQVDGKKLSTAIKRAMPFMSDDETRYVLNGVHFEASEEPAILKVVATDGRRLIVLEESVECQQGFQGIVSVLGLKLLASLPSVKVQIEDSESLIRATGTGWELYTKKIDGNYPFYAQVIPEESPDDVQIDVMRADLLGCLPFAGVVLEKGGAVTLVTEGSAVKVSSARPDIGETSSKILAKCEGQVAVGYNSGFLTEALESMTGERVTLRMKDCQSPMLMKEPGALVVLMPMRIS